MTVRRLGRTLPASTCASERADIAVARPEKVLGSRRAVYGPNLATVSGTTTEKGKDKDGKQFTRSYVWVDTWMERNGKWQCIAEGVMESRKKK